MDWWPLILVAMVGVIVGGAVILWPYLDPQSPIRSLWRLEDMLRDWGAIRDLRAEAVVSRSAEPPLKAAVLYLRGAAVRLELREPEELSGEVYILRPVPEGWLLVHYRPRSALGIEIRWTPEELEKLLSTLGLSSLQGLDLQDLERGRIKVSWIEERSFRLEGPAQTVEVELQPETNLPTRAILTDRQGQRLEIQVDALATNTGLELREILSLNPLPTRWIRIPSLEPGVGIP